MGRSLVKFEMEKLMTVPNNIAYNKRKPKTISTMKEEDDAMTKF